MDRLDPSLFKRMFRVSRDVFEYLLDKLEPSFSSNECQAKNSSGEPIALKTRLAVSLRWLAGGSYLDLCFAWGLGVSTFYAENGVLWPTMQALDELFPLGLPYDDPIKLDELSTGFKNHSGVLRYGHRWLRCLNPCPVSM